MLLHGKKVSCSWRTHDMHQPISYSCFFLWCMLVILPPSKPDDSSTSYFSNCSNLLDMTPAAGQDTSKHNISSNPVLFSMHIMFGLLQNLLYKSYYWWANKQVEAKSRRVSGKCHCVMLSACGRLNFGFGSIWPSVMPCSYGRHPHSVLESHITNWSEKRHFANPFYRPCSLVSGISDMHIN